MQPSLPCLCGFFPLNRQFLAQFPQSPNTDNYTELKGKQSLVFVTTAVSEAQFHQFIYILFLNVVRPVLKFFLKKIMYRDLLNYFFFHVL